MREHAASERSAIMPHIRKNPIAFTLILAAVGLGLSALAADAPDSATGLPLYPGLTFSQTVNSSICHSRSRMQLYDPGPDATLAEYLDWYKAHLGGYRVVQERW